MSVMWEEVDSETLSISEHPDIDLRGKVHVHDMVEVIRKRA